MGINLSSDFRSKNRIYGEKGAFFAPNTDGKSIEATGIINTTGKYTSGGIDLLTIFSAALSGSTGDSMLTFGGNLTGVAAYKPTGGPVTVGVSFNPTFGTITGALNGNANTASTWQTSRTFTFAGGNVTGSFSTNGSGDVSDIALNVLSVSSTRWDNVYTGFSNISANIVTGVLGVVDEQGVLQIGRPYGIGSFITLDDLDIAGSPTFANITISNNATIAGNLSVQGNLTFLDTLVTLTSALSVVNTGTGPALYIRQTGNTPLAEFIDSDGGKIIFGNNGTVAIGNAAATELLNVGGNILASSATFSAIPANGTSNTLVVSGAGGALGTRVADSRIWGSTLVNGSLTNNFIPKATGTNSIGNSLLSDNGTSVTLTATNSWMDVPELRISNTARTFQSRRDLFSSTSVATTGTKIPTFNRTNLQAFKFFVSLINGTTLTTCFEINGTSVPTISAVSGTIFGIVDSSGTSQLIDADLSLSDAANPSTLVLTISSFANGTTAIVDGTAIYNTLT